MNTMIEVDIVAKYEKAQHIVKGIDEIVLEYNEHFFIVRDFLPHKSIETIYKTRNVDELLIWLDTFLTARRVYIYLLEREKE